MSRFAPNQVQGSPRRSRLAMLLSASLGLHALFLFIPLAGSNQEAIPPPNPAEDNIAITRVPHSQPPDNSSEGSTAVAPSPPVQLGQPQALRQPSSPVLASPPTPEVKPATPNQQPINPSVEPVENPNRSLSNIPPPSMVITPLPAEEARQLLASLKRSDRVTAMIDSIQTWLHNRFAYQKQGTSRSDYSQNQEAWLAVIREEIGDGNLVDERYRPDLELTYHQRVCLQPEPWKKPIIGFVLNPEGAMVSEPVLLRKTGYGFLDAAVLEAFKSQSFEASRRIQAYTIEVVVEIDYGRYDCLKIQRPESMHSHGANSNS